jgi:hypothetical protein
MTDFNLEVKRIEKQIRTHGYDELAQKNFRKVWEKLGKK